MQCYEEKYSIFSRDTLLFSVQIILRGSKGDAKFFLRHSGEFLRRITTIKAASEFLATPLFPFCRVSQAFKKSLIFHN